jgi:hypothetical protein
VPPVDEERDRPAPTVEPGREAAHAGVVPEEGAAALVPRRQTKRRGRRRLQDGHARVVDAQERLVAVAEHRHRVPRPYGEAKGAVAEVDVRVQRQARREDADAIVDGDGTSADMRARRRRRGERDERR